jgi:hypothetical protein
MFTQKYEQMADIPEQRRDNNTGWKQRRRMMLLYNTLLVGCKKQLQESSKSPSKAVLARHFYRYESAWVQF